MFVSMCQVVHAARSRAQLSRAEQGCTVSSLAAYSLAACFTLANKSSVTPFLTVMQLCWSGLSLYIGSASTDIVATLTGSGSVAGQGASAPSAGEEVNMLAVGVSVVLAVGAVLYMGRVIQKAIKAAAEQEHKAE